jgi:hypothetical protein
MFFFIIISPPYAAPALSVCVLSFGPLEKYDDGCTTTKCGTHHRPLDGVRRCGPFGFSLPPIIVAARDAALAGSSHDQSYPLFLGIATLCKASGTLRNHGAAFRAQSRHSPGPWLDQLCSGLQRELPPTSA